MKTRDQLEKGKMKSYADNRRNTRNSNIQVGDTVLIKQQRRNKFTTPFNANPYQVISKNGTMITAQRGNHVITRNNTFFNSLSKYFTQRSRRRK